MININAFFVGFVVINAVALALLVGFAATTLTRFFLANRKQRVASHQPITRYYGRLALGH